MKKKSFAQSAKKTSTVSRLKKKRVKSLATLKRECDAVFSVFIRTRGMSEDGTNQCCSCGVVLPWKQLQAGHFVSRIYLSTRFDPDNTHPQCARCNMMGANMAGYSKFMMEVYGPSIFDLLNERSKLTVKFTKQDYLFKIAGFIAATTKFDK